MDNYTMGYISNQHSSCFYDSIYFWERLCIYYFFGQKISSEQHTDGVFMQVWGILIDSSSFVRPKMASAMAALLTVAQDSERWPWKKRCFLIYKLLSKLMWTIIVINLLSLHHVMMISMFCSGNDDEAMFYATNPSICYMPMLP